MPICRPAEGKPPSLVAFGIQFAMVMVTLAVATVSSKVTPAWSASLRVLLPSVKSPSCTFLSWITPPAPPAMMLDEV